MLKKIFISFVLVVVFFVSLFQLNNDDKTSKIVTYNGNNLRISVDGLETTTLPTSGTYYLANYSCKSKDTIITWDKENYKLNVSNGTKKGGVACYLDFQSQPKLADMKPGSYVAYTGNNGCSEESCNGRNANYVSEDKMGYCYNDNHQFIVNGWRLAYSKKGIPYLISAGATDCMCTNSDGTSSTACSTYLSSDDLNVHYINMDTIAVKYCNTEYSYSGVCDSNSAWAMNATNFKSIIGEDLISNCSGRYSDKNCGYTNDLIDNGGYYWFSARISDSSVYTSHWNSEHRIISGDYSHASHGIRPVLKLASSVSVVGGSGTYEDPYKIANNTFSVNGGTNIVNASNSDLVQLSLIGTEGVATMCINVDSSGCSNYIDFASTYTLDWSNEEDGEKVIYVYYKDAYGNIIASLSRKVLLDTVAPDNIIKVVNGETLRRAVVISGTGADTMCFANLNIIEAESEEGTEGEASAAVQTIDVSECVEWIPYQSSKKWKLSDGIGEKIVQAFFKDKAGNISTANTSVTVGSYKYSIDEDFFDTTTDSNINIVDGTTYPWEFLNGRFQSVNQGINSSTSFSNIQFTPTDDTVLSFDYGVSSESGFDKLTITLTGSDSSSVTLVSAVSGKNTGSKKDVNLTSGVTYTLKVSYVKDSANSFYDDFAYIDNLVVDVK